MGGTDHRQCGRMPDHQSYRSGRRNWDLTSVGPPDALWAAPAVLCAFASGQASCQNLRLDTGCLIHCLN